MGRRINYEYVKQDFEKKNYTLVSTEYTGIKSKLDYICNKHKKLGVQSVTYESFKNRENNCEICKRENKRIFPKRVDLHYDELFAKYKDKVFNEVGNEYTLNKIFSKNEKIHLDLTHNSCGFQYIVDQHKFLNKNCRCNNPLCPSKKAHGNSMSLNQVSKQIYDICGDEYTISGDYNGREHKIKFTHNICGNSFDMRISSFIYGGHRCPMCAHASRLQKITKSQMQFELEVKNSYENEYEVIGKYVNYATPVLIRHKLCGHLFNVRAGRIANGTSRCPICNSSSRGEEKIQKFLNKHNIKYIKQKKFDNLFGIGYGLLSYDFYLPGYNVLIEFQGIQHEKPVDVFGGQTQFEKQQEHDKRKRDYAKHNNINLLEIWYYDIDNISNIISEYLKKITEKIA